jgi:hypothetical protein
MNSGLRSKRIPSAVIGVLSEVMPDELTHANIDSLFLAAGAPDSVPEGSKPQKVQAWLRLINGESKDPLKVLGQILEGFMDLEQPTSGFWNREADQIEAFDLRRKRVRKALSRDGLQYNRGGTISPSTGTPVLSLMDLIGTDRHSHVDAEMRRALSNLDADPPAACLAAAAVLEAVFKTYLDKFSLEYSEGDVLAALWKKVSEHMRIKPGELEDEDIRRLASGLHSIASGMQGIRNRKSSAHGKSSQQSKVYAIKRKHARLAVHASHTLAIFVLDTVEEASLV